MKIQNKEVTIRQLIIATLLHTTSELTILHQQLQYTH